MFLKEEILSGLQMLVPGASFSNKSLEVVRLLLWIFQNSRTKPMANLLFPILKNNWCFSEMV